MGKLIFYYGTMGSAKTANALITRPQYIQNKRSVWLIKPATDTRDDREGKTIIKSRTFCYGLTDIENPLVVASGGDCGATRGNIGVAEWEVQTIGYKIGSRMYCTTWGI